MATREVIENQRWYPILGWSARLNADDPPPWSDEHGAARQSPSEMPALEWHVYKSEDYDADGWLYGAAFRDELGPMTRASVVRMRVWLGREPGTAEAEAKAEAAAAAAATEASAAEAKAAVSEDWKQLFPSAAGALGANDSEKLPSVATANAGARAATDTQEAKTLFPSLPPQLSPPKKAEEKAGGGGFFSKMSAAAFALPSSVINLAGESSKSAVLGTVQSIKEASLYALDHAQAATSAAISAEPQLPAHRIPPRRASKARGSADSADVNPFEVLSMLSKRFPDLSPVDRALVTSCRDDIEAHLAPPEPTISKQCKVCSQEFGMTKFRYQCGYCNESFCREDLPHAEILRAFGQSTPSKLCTNCHYIVKEKMDQQFTQWRNERVRDFMDDKLVLYFNTSTDTAVDKIMRAAEGTLAAAKSAPIGATAKMAVVSADFVRKYGRAGLLGFILRNEFMQSFATLKGLIGDLDDLGFHDAAIGTYYFMAMNRGERGASPESEREEHAGCDPISDDLLADILKFAPLALHAIYELDVLDIQRISKLQNFSLIYAHIQNQDVRHPSFALLGNKEKKSALLLIRGSKSVQDLLTDIQAHPEEIGLASGSSPREEASGGFVDAFAHNGMLKAAMWIKDRIVGSLRILHADGYQITLAGHSLGAGCASLLAVMLQKEFENLQCFAYAVPACVNFHVAESCVDFVHSIVLRDDFVPRAKASNIMKLVGELKGFKGCWRETASDDLEAFKDRAKTLWRPRKREWATEEADLRKGKLPPQFTAAAASEPKAADRESAGNPKAKDGKGDRDQVAAWTLTRTNLIEQMDKMAGTEEELVSAEARAEEEKVYEELVTTLVDDPKELYIPGRVTHVYFYKGIYEAVHVDRKCASLSHVPMFQNMLSDHLGRNYLSALRVVRDTRRMQPSLPEWVPFSTKTRCMCCDSPFTWNSTSSSEAQQNYDQHNCRKCGWLVCGGCSEKWKSIPEFGVNVPVRVCDRCFYEL
ncbi:hypothetical protein PybrP1_009205 [[Pythium] brassicae (nom. inval.)]|nr:hypothetical protein PybrP1_009205 [[Pythium] brassicae (nom. inval.)]